MSEFVDGKAVTGWKPGDTPRVLTIKNKDEFRYFDEPTVHDIKNVCEAYGLNFKDVFACLSTSSNYYMICIDVEKHREIVRRKGLNDEEMMLVYKLDDAGVKFEQAVDWVLEIVKSAEERGRSDLA